MKPKLNKYLSLTLAGLLQILPLMRSALPAFLTAVRSPMGALVARWAAGGVAYFGYHAISGATSLNYSISISPATAQQGKAYNGTLTWTGGFSGSTASMSIYATNGVYLGSTCLGSSYQITPGLFIQYSGGATATISGTPTTTNLFTMGCEIYRSGGCVSNSIYEALRTSPAFTIISSNGASVGPTFNNPPQNNVAILGNSVNLFGSANGNPLPAYQWSQNLVPISGATNAAYPINNVQLANAGTYSLTASNSVTHPSANCVLTVVVPPGTNFTTIDWTNYAPAGVSLTLTSFLTNTASSTTTYSWEYNYGTSISSAQNFTFTPTVAKSGTYSVFFNSSFGTNIYANNVEADSQWQFGFSPVITNQPSPVSVTSGSNATLTCTLAGGNFPNIFLYKNGTTLVAQTNFVSYNPSSSTLTTNLSFTLTNVTSANAGNYTFVVTNFWGSTTSSVAALTVSSPISVSAPAGNTNYAGKSVSLSVNASGTPPFSYQWQKGTSNLSNGGNISGATTNVLTFNPAATTNSGNYQVIVTNMSGSVTSSVATVLIVPLPVIGVSLGSTSTTLTASGGVAGSNYIVETSTNLAGSNWIFLITNAVPGNGFISYTDTNAPTNGQRFYRIQFP